MKLVIATHNHSKFERYQRMLQGSDGIDILSLSDLGITDKVAEPFTTAKENAIHKAKEYAKITQLPTLAIDEAVSTNFLPANEQPGVYVRRYADRHHEMSDDEQLVFWKKIFDVYPQQNKQFIWDFQIAFFNSQKNELFTSQSEMISFVAQTFSQQTEPGYPMSTFLIAKGTEKN
jgi:XTP/dITP diphosphohydrolase